jgi:nitrous oxidase accessory protein NosD
MPVMAAQASRHILRVAMAAAAVAVALAAASTAAARVVVDPSTGIFNVLPSGSDSSACTAAAPCKTIGHAVAQAGAGSLILVGPGTYAEQVTVDKQLILDGHGATIDASGKINGIVISGAASSGSIVQGFTVENAIGEGILAMSTSNLGIQNNTLMGNDTGANTPVTPACTKVGDVPGDCGEAVHLMGVASSRVVNNDIHNNVGGVLLTDEVGPTHDNLVASNTIHDNAEDCGITLPSHNPVATTDPSRAGVYGNLILGNVSERNGGAGIGMFAPAPGMASYDNQVIGNTVRDNNEAGIAIHAHAPGQNVSGNVIVGNTISGNGVDPDADSKAPVGIAILTVDPSSGTIAGNFINDEQFGVFVNGPFTATGLVSNIFGSGVQVPVGQH